MRMLSAAVVMVLLTAPAYAQTPNVNLIPELQSKSPEEKEQDAIKEKAYKDSLRKFPTPRRPPIRGAPCAAPTRPRPQRRPSRRPRPEAATSNG